MENKITVKGAQMHNLQNIDLVLPKNQIIALTGVSGSGKSSLAFDTIFAEGQRRYIESLSPYARQFLGQMDRPKVKRIDGLSPAISIGQKALSHNPRSTVGTLTEIYDYLRVLFARIGKPYCPLCGREIKKMSAEEIFNFIKEESFSELTILAPMVRGRKGEYYQLLYDLLNQGYSEARIDNKIHSLHERILLPRYKTHTIEAVVDRIPARQEESRLFEAIESALNLSKGLINIVFSEKGKKKANQKERLLSAKRTCPHDGFSFPELEPRLFSFNSPYGACEECHGTGRESFFSDKVCPECEGKRLRPESLSVRIKGKNIDDLSSLTIDKIHSFFENLPPKLNSKEMEIAESLINEIKSRLTFLLEVGLDYLSLRRETSTLSGGEAQRIRLASQLGSNLSDTLYVLDEPTIGLHERDNYKLINTLKKLRDLNNTLIVVEHNEQVVKNSDYFVELGPKAGNEGGKVVKTGKISELLKDKNQKSLTLSYLRKEKQIKAPNRRKTVKGKLQLKGAKANNLKNINLELPLGRFICISGVSGSGKSTLLEKVLYKDGIKKVHNFSDELENSKDIRGAEYLKRIAKVDQGPIGRSPRSNPATYTGVLTPIRELFSYLPEAQERGYSPARFSFNVEGGRCEACKGAGYKLIEMHFLPPILTKCEVCKGKRFNRETLEVKYKGKNIYEILEMTVDEALKFFKGIPAITEKLGILQEIGLGYLKLGQSSKTLSGGESQRIKLARELSSYSRSNLYILDEPTVGLHSWDIEFLLKVIQKLVDRNNTVAVIEHNLNILKSADYIIDLGPEGGDKGGKVVAKGTPEEVSRNKNSYTGQYLKKEV